MNQTDSNRQNLREGMLLIMKNPSVDNIQSWNSASLKTGPCLDVFLMEILILLLFPTRSFATCRSQWPCGLRRGSRAARLLGLWVRIPPGHGCLSVFDLETSRMRRSWPALGRSATKKNFLTYNFMWKKNQFHRDKKKVLKNLPDGVLCTFRMLVLLVAVVFDTKCICVALGAQLILGILSSTKAPLKVLNFSLFR